MADSKWYSNSMIYRIYPRSFHDSNADGVGDLAGISSKLGYIKELGAKGICLSSVFAMESDPFDSVVTDYKSIYELFGTMEDLENLAEKAHSIGLKLILEMPIDFTSFEHEWFQAGRKDPASPFRQMYIWSDSQNPKKAPDGKKTQSRKPRWRYDEAGGGWFLADNAGSHPTLDISSKELESELKSTMDYYAGLGIDGFRVSITARKDDPEHAKSAYALIASLHAHCSDKGLVLSSAEMDLPFDQLLAHALAGDIAADGISTFETLKLGPSEAKPSRMKAMANNRQRGMFLKCQNDLFSEHEMYPRSQRLCSQKPELWEKAAKMLAVSSFMQQGAAYVYQGQEIGMGNPPYGVLDLDMSSAPKACDAFYRKWNMPPALSPMQWDDSARAGFSKSTPWAEVNPEYRRVNAARQQGDRNSILEFYKKLFSYRNGNEICEKGYYKDYCMGSDRMHAFMRTYGGKTIVCICNYMPEASEYTPHPELCYGKCKLALHNYGYDRPMLEKTTLRPYETLVYEIL